MCDILRLHLNLFLGLVSRHAEFSIISNTIIKIIITAKIILKNINIYLYCKYLYGVLLR